MGQKAIRVLLISETEHGCSNLRNVLEIRGCLCCFGSSFEEAAALFERHSFHLVLSTIPFHQYDRLLVRLSGLPSTVFQSFLVEDGCWWLPLARCGVGCLGAPAMRANELLGAIEQIVIEARSRPEMTSHAGA